MKRENRAVFSADSLKVAQDSLEISSAEMSRALNTPLRTYQDWLAGKSRIPGVVEVAVTLLIERVNWSVSKVINESNERIRRDFPNGIRG